MYKVIIGIDNGVSGTIGIIGEQYTDFMETPVFSEQNYTKQKDNITRIDTNRLREIFIRAMEENKSLPEEVLVVMERPMVNPTRFKATTSALRSLEAELVTIEAVGFAHIYCDSKEWQKKELPQGISSSEELKRASKDIGCRLYPQFKTLIQKHKDADGMLIAHHFYKEYK